MMYQSGDLVKVTVEKTKLGHKIDQKALYVIRHLNPSGSLALQKQGPYREQVVVVDAADVLPQDISLFLERRREDFLQGLRDLEALEAKVKEREEQDAERANEEKMIVNIMAAIMLLSETKTEEAVAS